MRSEFETGVSFTFSVWLFPPSDTSYSIPVASAGQLGPLGRTNVGMSLIQSVKMDSLARPIVIALIAFALGYQARPLLSRSFSTTPATSSSKKRKLADASSSLASPETGSPSNPTTKITPGGTSDDATDTDSDAEDEAAALATDLSAVSARLGDEVKLVLVVNDSLKMSKGKIAAQAGHATLACALTLHGQNPRLYRKWQSQGQPKIALRCATTEELDSLASQARRLNLCARTIQDAGRTQVAAGSKTIVGIGPGPARLINTVTGKLKLL